jgi:hypothetical protein
MSSEWFYHRDGRNAGPISSQQLRKAAKNEWLSPTDIVWKKGLKTWVLASKVNGLFPPKLIGNSPITTPDKFPPLPSIDISENTISCDSTINFKCPNCGAANDISETAEQVKCQFCGVMHESSKIHKNNSTQNNDKEIREQNDKAAELFALYLKTEQYINLNKLCDELISKEPKNGGAWAGKGIAEIHLNGVTTTAIKCLSTAMEYNPYSKVVKNLYNKGCADALAVIKGLVDRTINEIQSFIEHGIKSYSGLNTETCYLAAKSAIDNFMELDAKIKNEAQEILVKLDDIWEEWYGFRPSTPEITNQENSDETCKEDVDNTMSLEILNMVSSLISFAIVLFFIFSSIFVIIMIWIWLDNPDEISKDITLGMWAGILFLISLVFFCIWCYFNDRKCPNCGILGAGEIVHSEVLNQNYSTKQVTHHDRISNTRGETVGYHDRTENVLQLNQEIAYVYACRYCEHVWQKNKVHSSDV